MQIDSRFSEEQSRAHQYLSVTTAEPIRHILQDTLLTPHLHHIIGMSGSGLDVMIDNEKTDDLSRLYRLFVTVPEGLPCLRRAIKESVIRRGKEFNNDTPMDQMDDADGGEEQAAPAGKGKGKARATTGAQSLALALKWVEDVLRLKDKFDAVWKDCFKVDREIESGLNEVCIVRSMRDVLILTLVAGFRIVYQSAATSTRIRLALHRREPQEGTQRGQRDWTLHSIYSCSLTFPVENRY